MFYALRKRTDLNDQRGFTLLELIVAMVVLAILAGIAIPVFLHQRRKGWVAHVHAALTHMARAENNHVYTAGVGGYTTNIDELVDTGFRFNDEYVEPLVLAADSQGFCIQMTSTKDPSIVWHFNSEVGKPAEGPGSDDACGLPPGTLVAGEFDPTGNDPNDPDGPDVAGRTDTDGDGIPDDEDPTPGGQSDSDGDGDFEIEYPGGSSGSNGNPPPPPGGPGSGPTPENTPPPVTNNPNGDDCTPGSANCPPGGGSSTTTGGGSTTGGGGGNGGDGGCRGDRNDPDGGNNGGRDEIGGVGGTDDDRDCNNGSGNDDDGDDDNNAGGKKK